MTAIKLSAPFIADPGYAAFLAGLDHRLSSIYFALNESLPDQNQPLLLDARVKPAHTRGLSPDPLPRPALADCLAPLAHVKKYILANTRFVSPALYTDTKKLNRFLDRISRLHHAVGINGIVISDFYLVKALAGTKHKILPEIEVVPGINCMLDSPEKLDACLDLIRQTGFALPQRIIADRSLNRDLKKLARLHHHVKTVLKAASLELLANEGCIYQCPFKLSHDAHISLSNTGLVKEATWQINRTLGCYAYFNDHPHKFLKSPFIRPEDTDRYKGLADSIKLGGRTLGTRFLTRCVRAYAQKSYDGSLLDLMDAAGQLGQRFHISNTKLGPGFFTALTTCTKDCNGCRICPAIFNTAARIKPVTLKPLKEFQ